MTLVSFKFRNLSLHAMQSYKIMPGVSYSEERKESTPKKCCIMMHASHKKERGNNAAMLMHVEKGPVISNLIPRR